MNTPQEIEVWYVLPSIRRELTRIMKRDYKLTQRNIASILGVTEAAISQYNSLKRAKGVDFSETFKKEIESSAKKIVEKKDSMVYELQRLCNLAKNKKVLCKIHAKFDKDLPENCDLCFDR